MLTVLTEVEVRVLGSLIEKQITTPEYYPLTLNALTLACNQKNNRNPVTAYDEATVAGAVESLRVKNLAYVFYGSNSRVPKYKHVVLEIFHLSHSELSLMCLLMLRGPQTVGELHGRSGRMFDFKGLEDVEETVNSLISKDPDPLVIRLPPEKSILKQSPSRNRPGKLEAAGRVRPKESPTWSRKSNDLIIRCRAFSDSSTSSGNSLNNQPPACHPKSG